MVAALAGLMVSFKSTGLSGLISKVGKFQKRFGSLAKSIQPTLKKLSTTFGKFGLVASGVFFTLMRASPRLAAEMDVLNIRINQLIRPLGDELAPALRYVSDLINSLRLGFEALPEPIRQAILFGGALAIAVGVLTLAFGALSLAASPVTLAILAIAVAGAALYLAWETNFGGLRDITESTFESMKPLFESINNLLGGMGDSAEENTSTFATAFEALGLIFGTVFETIGSYITSLTAAWTGIIDFIDAIFKGDLEAALKAVQDVFKNAFDAFFDIIWLPVSWLQGMITALTGTDILGDLVKTGQKIIAAFFEGVLSELDKMGEGVIAVLEWLMSFFGGSLPERGPLKDMGKFGEELGSTYVMSIGAGVESRHNTVSRDMNIENINLIFREEQLSTERTFFAGMSEGVRRGRS